MMHHQRITLPAWPARSCSRPVHAAPKRRDGGDRGRRRRRRASFPTWRCSRIVQATSVSAPQGPPILRDDHTVAAESADVTALSCGNPALASGLSPGTAFTAADTKSRARATPTTTSSSSSSPCRQARPALRRPCEKACHFFFFFPLSTLRRQCCCRPCLSRHSLASLSQRACSSRGSSAPQSPAAPRSAQKITSCTWYRNSGTSCA